MEIKPVDADKLPASILPFLASIEHGSDVDIRTPFFDGEDRQVIAEKWANILFQLPGLDPRLMTYEMKQQKKMGPLSIRLPFIDRKSDVESYYTKGIKDDIEFPVLTAGYLPSSGRLRPLGTTNSASQLPLNTNSGLPFFTKRNKVQEQSIGLADLEETFPAVLGWRGQASGTNVPKQRVVWMFPFSTNILEYSIFQPLHNQLIEQGSFEAWKSMDAVDSAISGIIDTGRVVLSSDFSGYDQTITTQQAWFFDYVRSMYQKDDHTRYLIKLLEHNLRYIPLVVSRDHMYTGKHGMPSGSVFTNMGDSVINYLAQMSSPVANEFIQIQGDDAVTTVDDIDLHLKHLESLGFEANLDKQYIETGSALYLQRLHLDSNRVGGIIRGIYPTFRALNSLLGQERFFKDWSKELLSLRALAILENCKWHPFFKEFVEFVVKYGDPQLKENTINIINGKRTVDIAKALPGFAPSYNQETGLNGLSAFRSVEIILNQS